MYKTDILFISQNDIQYLLPSSGVGSSREKIPYVQGQNQQPLGDTPHPNQRNHSNMVGTERGHQRTDRLKPQSQKNYQSNHMEPAFSISMKLWAMPCRATQEGQVMMESSDKMWPTGEGNDKPLHYSCLENPMNSMKRQKDRILKDELPRSAGAQ